MLEFADLHYLWDHLMGADLGNKQMIRLLLLILIAALLTGCTRPYSERIRTSQFSDAPVLAFAGQQGRHERLQVSGQAV